VKHGVCRTGRPTLLVAIVLLSFACSRPARQLPLHPIVVYGDCRTGHDVHRKIVAYLTETEPLAVFNTGDLVTDGSSADEWTMFNNITSELRETVPYYPALGNHDLPPELYLSNFDLPNNERWYSVDVEGLLFVVLDTNSPIDQASEQYGWLQSQLQNATGGFVAVVFHHPLLSTGPHSDEQGLSPILVPLFEQYRVDVVFNGHDHDYERSYREGIYYVVIGGGGAPLRDQARTNEYSQVFAKAYGLCTLSVNADNVTVKTFDLRKRLIDEFTIGLN
jgi:acid phosphatase type 7